MASTRNPADAVQPNKEHERERYVQQHEMRSLLSAVEQEGNPFLRALLWLYLLTGVRKTELLSATWNDVDLERDPQERLGLAQSR